MTQRRDVLRGIAGGGLASIATLAGCSALPSGGAAARELPSYHRYVPAEDAGSAGSFFAVLDVARLRELEDEDLGSELPDGAGPGLDGDGGAEDAEPMLAYPVVGLFVVAFGLSFGLLPYGFSDEVMDGFDGTAFGEEAAAPGAGAEESGEADGAARVDAVVMVDGAFVLEGTFDEDAITSSADGFEHAGRRAGFEVYEGSGGDSLYDTGDLAFAVEEDTLVLLTDAEDGQPRSALEALLDVAAGEGERLSEDGDADWALRTAGHGLVALGGWGVEPDEAEQAGDESMDELGVESVLDGAHGLVSSLSVEEAATRADVAAVFPEGQTPDRETVADELGATATERSVEVDGSRVSVTATWSDEGPTES